MIASRRIEKVFAADDFSGVAIAGAAGPGDRDGEAVPGAARALREGAGRRAQPRGQGQPARPARARQPARGDAGLRGRPAVRRLRPSTRATVASSPTTSPAAATKSIDYQAQGSGSVHARNWIKSGWRDGMTVDEAIDLAIRALFAAADEDVATGGPDLVRGIFPIGRRRSTPTASARSTTPTSPNAASPSSRPGAGR